jgi:hypothetical protein
VGAAAQDVQIQGFPDQGKPQAAAVFAVERISGTVRPGVPIPFALP